MINEINQAVAIIGNNIGPDGFEDAKMAVLAGGLGALGIAYGVHSDTHDPIVERGEIAPFADPDFNKQGIVTDKRSRTFDRIGYYAAIATATLAFAQYEGKPYVSNYHQTGRLTLVTSANISQQAADMTNLSGEQTLRVDASIDGSVIAAENESKIPSTLIVTGSTSDIITNSGINKSNAKYVEELARKDINSNGFIDGDDLVGGVQQGEILDKGSNNEIIIASDLSASEQNQIKLIEASIKKSKSGTHISAVVVGSSSANIESGAQDINSDVNESSFTEVLGARNVLTATSEKQVIQDIEKFSQNVNNVDNKKPSKLPWAEFGVIAVGLGLIRRVSGFNKRLIRRVN